MYANNINKNDTKYIDNTCILCITIDTPNSIIVIYSYIEISYIYLRKENRETYNMKENKITITTK